MGIVAGSTEGATNSTVGLELEGLHLSSCWKVAACGVLQYGCPGRALALRLPGGHREPRAGEVVPEGGSRAGSLADHPDQVANSQLFFFFFFGLSGQSWCFWAGRLLRGRW